jgi:hypothetical protein
MEAQKYSNRKSSLSCCVERARESAFWLQGDAAVPNNNVQSRTSPLRVRPTCGVYKRRLISDALHNCLASIFESAAGQKRMQFLYVLPRIATSLQKVTRTMN